MAKKFLKLLCQKYIKHIANNTIITNKMQACTEAIALNNLASLYLSENEYDKSIVFASQALIRVEQIVSAILSPANNINRRARIILHAGMISI